MAHETFLFSLFFINFLRAPELWSFQRSWLWVCCIQYVHGWLNIISSMGTSQPSSTISSARSFLCTSRSPGLPSTSVNASDYIPVVALLFLSQPPCMSVISLVHSSCIMFWRTTQLLQPFSLSLDSTGAWSSPPQAQHAQQNSSKPCLPTTASLLTWVRLDQNWVRFYRDFNRAYNKFLLPWILKR